MYTSYPVSMPFQTLFSTSVTVGFPVHNQYLPCSCALRCEAICTPKTLSSLNCAALQPCTLYECCESNPNKVAILWSTFTQKTNLQAITREMSASSSCSSSHLVMASKNHGDSHRFRITKWQHFLCALHSGYRAKFTGIKTPSASSRFALMRRKLTRLDSAQFHHCCRIHPNNYKRLCKSAKCQSVLLALRQGKHQDFFPRLRNVTKKAAVPSRPPIMLFSVIYRSRSSGISSARH